MSASPAQLLSRVVREDGMHRWLRVGSGGALRMRKLLDPRLALDGELSRRWLARVEQGRALRHPFCARVQASGRSDGDPFVESEWADGLSLHAVIERRDLEPAQVVRIVCDVLEPLEEALAVDAGLAHLDLDPSGVMVAPDGSLTLPEFGLWSVLPARQRAWRRMERARTAYAPPELLQADEVGTRGDIFTLGEWLHRWLSGRELASGLRAVIDTMTAEQPCARFQTPALARAALVRYADGDASAWREALAGRVRAAGCAVVAPEPRTKLGRMVACFPSAQPPAPPPPASPPSSASLPTPSPLLPPARLAPAPVLRTDEVQAEPVPPPLLAAASPAPELPPARAPKVHDGKTELVRSRPPLAQPALGSAPPPREPSRAWRSGWKEPVSRAWSSVVSRVGKRPAPQPGTWRDPSSTVFAHRPLPELAAAARAGADAWPRWMICTVCLAIGLPALLAAYLLFLLSV